MSSVVDTLRGLFFLTYFTVGIVQFVAAISGIQEFFDISGVFAWIVGGIGALFIAFIPVLGAVAGVYGSVAAWDWPVWGAIALFTAPLTLGILYRIMEVVTGVEPI